MEKVDNDNIAENSDQNEILDAAITYKNYRTYPSNSLKDRKGQFEKELYIMQHFQGKKLYPMAIPTIYVIVSYNCNILAITYVMLPCMHIARGYME